MNSYDEDLDELDRSFEAFFKTDQPIFLQTCLTFKNHHLALKMPTRALQHTQKS